MLFVLCSHVCSMLFNQMMLSSTIVYLYYSIHLFWLFFGAGLCSLSLFYVLLFGICFIKHVYFKLCVFIYHELFKCWPEGQHSIWLGPSSVPAYSHSTCCVGSWAVKLRKYQIKQCDATGLQYFLFFFGGNLLKVDLMCTTFRASRCWAIKSSRRWSLYSKSILMVVKAQDFLHYD